MNLIKFLAILMSFFILTSVYAKTETATQYVKSASITADIKARYLAASDLKSYKISVTTKKGVVTLKGKLGSQSQIDEAVEIANEVDGVQSINNKLTLAE